MHKSKRSGDRAPILIACVGRVGSGKSSFIRTIAEQHSVQQEMTYCSSKIEEVTVVINGRTVTLVDTPGFDGANTTETSTLRVLSDHLELVHKNVRALSGIIFFKRITTSNPSKMHALDHETLRMFASLCGRSAPRSVILCTTMWDRVQAEAGEKALKALSSIYWRRLMDYGSEIRRHDGTQESAVSILHALLDRLSAPLRHSPSASALLQHDLGHQLRLALTQNPKGDDALLRDLLSAVRSLHREMSRSRRESVHYPQKDPDHFLRKGSEHFPRKESEHLTRRDSAQTFVA